MIVALRTVLLAALCALALGHGYMREPIQRGMEVGAADYQGPLTNTDCGVADDVPLNPTMEATVGDTVLIKWQANHPGSDPEITVKFGDFADRDNVAVDDWPVIFNDNVYEDGQAEVVIPAVPKTGVYSFQWSWLFGATYYSCGDILVNVPPAGEEVEEALCPSACNGRGSCQASSDPNKFICACESGFAGAECENEVGGAFVLVALVGVAFVVATVVGYNRRKNQNRLTGPPGYGEFGSFGGANPNRSSLGSKQGGRGRKSKSGRGSKGSKTSRGSRGSKNSRRSLGSKKGGGGAALSDDRMTQASSVKRTSVDEDGNLAGMYASTKSVKSSKSNRSKGSKKSKGSKGSRRSKQSKGSRRSRGSKRAAGSKHH